MSGEVWRTIPEFPLYEASNLGRVRRVDATRRAPAGHVLKPQILPNGYRNVSVYRGDGSHSKRYVHALVLAAFVGPRPPGHEGDHKDGDKGNNRLSNLSWVTSAENKRRARGLGLMGVGANHPGAKFTDEVISAVRASYAAGEGSMRVLARRFGMSVSHVSLVVRGIRRPILDAA